MSDDTGFNGWTNYETWNVALWLDNDQGNYYTVMELADDAVTNELSAYDLAEQIKAFVEDIAEQTCPGVIEGASFVADMFGKALAQVNWHEIAKNALTDATDRVDA